MIRPRVVHAFVFVGAVLLFSLEPMVGRMLLPRFGGGFHVWTTALMFFQGALFLAYAYAHLVAPRLGAWHLAVCALPLIAVPITMGEAPTGGTGAGGILLLLARHVALPFGVLATTAVVAQRWWAVRPGGPSPYGLYAVSNGGSLLALVLYVVAVEPLLGLEAQRWAWAAGYVVYVGLAALAWWGLRRETVGETETETATATETDSFGTLTYWALLAAAPSAFLMAVTNLIALDAGNVPLVWVVPLAIYLASFVVAFADPEPGDVDGTRVPGTVRRLWPHIAAVGLFFFSGGDAGGGWIDVIVHLVVLAFVTLAAHGELYRARPPATRLTRYYLVVAFGGGVGGAFVALLAPAAFTGLAEYPIALVVLAITIAVGRRADLRRWLGAAPRLALVVSAALLAVIVYKVVAASTTEDARETLAVRRSAYGIYRVTRTATGQGAVRDLVSGTTRHGRQREGDLTPLSYYHPRGPLGDALSTFDAPRRVGVVGLGVGAAAGHLGAGDAITFYEIDEVVVALARAHFSYLGRTPADVDVVVGDARVALATEARRFDLLFVDAFAGDAIPTHLLTIEALRLYLSRTTEGGLVLLHVSNRYYDLVPVLAAAARALGVRGAEVNRDSGLAEDQDAARCVALGRDPARIEALVRERGWRRLGEGAGRRAARPFTDDHANLFDALRWMAR